MIKESLTFDDVLLVPKINEISSRKDVETTSRSITGRLVLQLPIISANMDTITESDMCVYMAEKGGMGILHRFMTIEENVKEVERILAKDNKRNLPFAVSVGTGSNEQERAIQLWNAGAYIFCVDVAHGHASYAAEMVQWLRLRFPGAEIIAGNVATAKGAKFLEDAGANIIKVGIGPGSVCSTRIKTGFGVGQLTAIEECSSALNHASVIADGGIKTPGDVVKALAFGADFVMLGGMLAGVHCVPIKGRYQFRGMASEEVAREYKGKLDEWKTAEGVSRVVSYLDKESTDRIIDDINGGLRSGLTYCGADNLRQLRRRMEYTKISNSVLQESKPHFK